MKCYIKSDYSSEQRTRLILPSNNKTYKAVPVLFPFSPSSTLSRRSGKCIRPTLVLPLGPFRPVQVVPLVTISGSIAIYEPRFIQAPRWSYDGRESVTFRNQVNMNRSRKKKGNGGNIPCGGHDIHFV